MMTNNEFSWALDDLHAYARQADLPRTQDIKNKLILDYAAALAEIERLKGVIVDMSETIDNLQEYD